MARTPRRHDVAHEPQTAYGGMTRKPKTTGNQVVYPIGDPDDPLFWGGFDPAPTVENLGLTRAKAHARNVRLDAERYEREGRPNLARSAYLAADALDAEIKSRGADPKS